uniref:Cytochrome c oxidase subunit 2 n=1 Tax=Calisoga longitarsis TaxID=394809 RepID=B2CKU6_9ARAC|nr:cytochrome oxidase subunit 2 [Calisoga longitarsis]
MPTWGSLYFQNATSPVMEQLIFFHDHVMVVLIIVTILVGYVLLSSIFGLSFNRHVLEGQELESIWTVLPAVFLLMIALPSLSLLYVMEEMDDPDVSVKVVGHQWYWSYEYADMGEKVYDSYMIPDGEEANFRLMEVDNSLSIPAGVGVRMIVTSGDVIHSWTVPDLGVKADGIPGRLNQVLFLGNSPGLHVGQCSEICGVNHSFMPIVIYIINGVDFLDQW